MNNKQLGRAQYTAIRSGSTIKLIATGTKPTIQAKPDFEQLAFLIFPPVFGFYFISPQITSPMVVPFTFEADFSYPPASGTVRIHDADGVHSVAIKDSPALPPPSSAEPSPADLGYCVFKLASPTSILLVAKCDGIHPALYIRVFGPDTYANCKAYVAAHGGQGL